MMNNKRRNGQSLEERKQLWPNQGTTQTFVRKNWIEHEEPVNTASVLAEIRTEHLGSTILEHYIYSSPYGNLTMKLNVSLWDGETKQKNGRMLNGDSLYRYYHDCTNALLSDILNFLQMFTFSITSPYNMPYSCHTF
jgi:hypothetical protein